MYIRKMTSLLRHQCELAVSTSLRIKRRLWFHKLNIMAMNSGYYENPSVHGGVGAYWPTSGYMLPAVMTTSAGGESYPPISDQSTVSLACFGCNPLHLSSIEGVCVGFPRPLDGLGGFC